MLSFFKKLKYRSEVLPNVYAILLMVPELKTILNNCTGLNNIINEFGNKQTPPLEAAAYISMIVIEKLMGDIPSQTRHEIVKQLKINGNDGFFWFGETGYRIKRGDVGYPEGILPITMVIGVAFWYLGRAERDRKLSVRVYKIFIVDVGGMLLGYSPDERAKNRFGIAFDDITHECEEIFTS